MEKLRRPWFAGGTITIASVQGDGYYLAPGEAGFEDGTVNYLSIPAVEIGLQHLAAIGWIVIHDAGHVPDRLADRRPSAMRHATGQPFVTLHGPASLERARGDGDGQLFGPQTGSSFDDRRIEELAN